MLDNNPAAGANAPRLAPEANGKAMLMVSDDRKGSMRHSG
jgi:hypothetical protein